MRTFLVLSAVVAVVSCGILQVSVQPRESLKTLLKRLGQWEIYVESRSGTYPQHMNDYGDFVYVGNVSIGNPPQNFTVDFDTGSSDFFVPYLQCGYYKKCDVKGCQRDPDTCLTECPKAICDGKPYVLPRGHCNRKRSFDPAVSRSFAQSNVTFSDSYGAGGASGLTGIDSVRLGDDGVLLVRDYHFGLVTCLDTNFELDYTSDGMFGLSPGATHTGGNGKTLVEAAYEQGHLDQPMFTAWLERKGGDARNVPGGVYTFGGVDRENCGRVLGYYPVTKAPSGSYIWWKFDLDGVSMGNYEKRGKWEAVSDSGTTYIITKRQHIKRLVKRAGAVWNKTTEALGKFPIDCDATFDPLVLIIGGRRYHIDHKQLIKAGSSTGQCYFGVKTTPVGQRRLDVDFMLGDPWVRQFCQIHDFGQKRIGFAKAKP